MSENIFKIDDLFFQELQQIWATNEKDRMDKIIQAINAKIKAHKEATLSARTEKIGDKTLETATPEERTELMLIIANTFLSELPDSPPKERMILYGRPRNNDPYEYIIGFLIPLAEGIVILDASYDAWTRALSGLLVGTQKSETQLFSLRPFSSSIFSANLDIYPSTFPEGKRKRFELCPAWFSWSIGAGHSDDHMNLGIDSCRWEILEPWLDRWLPEL